MFNYQNISRIPLIISAGYLSSRGKAYKANNENLRIPSSCSRSFCHHHHPSAAEQMTTRFLHHQQMRQSAVLALLLHYPQAIFVWYIIKVWSTWSTRSPFANGRNVQSISSSRLFLWHSEDVTKKFQLAVPNQMNQRHRNRWWCSEHGQCTLYSAWLCSMR